MFSHVSPQVKYREKYINSLGTWKSIPDRPEFFFSRIVNDNVSSVSTAARYFQFMLLCSICSEQKKSFHLCLG